MLDGMYIDIDIQVITCAMFKSYYFDSNDMFPENTIYKQYDNYKDYKKDVCAGASLKIRK